MSFNVKKLALLAGLVLLAVFSCSEEKEKIVEVPVRIRTVDTVYVTPNTPPFPPDGVFSVTGDGLVSIYWNPNFEDDLAGYGVYRNDELYGYYTWLADVPANQTYYLDYDVTNGETWYYAVTAIDSAGLESDLSYDVVFDTPRPEGFNLVLMDYLVQDDQSGYDFDTETRQASGLDTTVIVEKPLNLFG